MLAHDRDGGRARRFFPDGTVGREDRSPVFICGEAPGFINQRYNELHALCATRAAGELVPGRQRAMAHVVRRTAAERGRHRGWRVDQGGGSAGGTEG